MSELFTSISTGVTKRDPLLVASKLNKFPQLLLTVGRGGGRNPEGDNTAPMLGVLLT